MRIKTNVNLLHECGHIPAGSEMLIDDAIGKQLVQEGKAVCLDAPDERAQKPAGMAKARRARERKSDDGVVDPSEAFRIPEADDAV